MHNRTAAARSHRPLALPASMRQPAMMAGNVAACVPGHADDDLPERALPNGLTPR